MLWEFLGFCSIVDEVPTFLGHHTESLIPIATMSKACVCGHSLAGIVGLNHTGGMMSVSCECHVLSGTGL